MNGIDEESVLGVDPVFDKLIDKVIVMKNQTALLPCSIDFLGIYKVLWLDINNLPITYEEKRIIDDSRFGIIRASETDWNLQIRDVRIEDEGRYRCSINTNPLKTKIVELHVKIPPSIINTFDGDIIANEGETIKLYCNATGVPKPNVIWKKKSNESKLCKFKSSAINEPYSVYIMANVTRHCYGGYVCIATNDVPPPASKLFNVIIEFAPKIHMPNNRIFQAIGKETILICSIFAFPHAVNHWEKNGKRVISSDQFSVDAYLESENNLMLSLKIKIKTKSDYGEYKCVAANRLGKQEMTMLLMDELSSMDKKYSNLTASSEKMKKINGNKPSNVQNELSLPIQMLPTLKFSNAGVHFIGLIYCFTTVNCFIILMDN